MLNRFNDAQELEQVNMFIRAIAADMAETEGRSFANSSDDSIAIEMEEALYELRVRKLLISALIDAEKLSDGVTAH
ncbi:MAG TPA: hypothetical protein VKN18_13765 [Blastocatellia bacterium]|nr:hypothetical protein [Blastocatellia bacterium]